MADGKIVIDVDVNGKKLSDLGNDLQKLETTAKNSGSGLDNTGRKMKQVGDEAGTTSKKTKETASGFEGLTQKIKNFSVGAVAFKATGAAMDLLATSTSRAIERFDTLERYPKVMQALGYSAKDVAASTKELSDGIEGLPTSLDEVVKTTQQLTSMTGDLKNSTKLALALNNAFLASEASSADASRGLQQFTQMLSAGKVDMQAWKTLQETMPYALQKTAESFGFAGQSAQRDFYAALQSGQITFKDFSNRLIELNKGTNGFAEMAKKNSSGIQTSFNNIINAVAKGVANVIKAFDDMSKAVTGKSIAENLNSLKGVVNNTFTAIISVIKGVTPVIKTVVQVLSFLKPVFDALTPVITGAVAGVVAYKTAMMGLAVINGVKGWIGGLIQSLLKFVSTATVAEGATLTFGTAMSSLSTGGLSLAIGAAVGAIAGLVGWLTRETEGQKKAREAAEKHKQELDSLSESIKGTTESYKERRREIDAEAKDNERLIKKIQELSSVQSKTAKEKKELANAAQTLNSRVAGLNITYDKATGSINMTADAIRRQVEASKQSSEASLAQERMLEIAKQRASVEEKLAGVKEKLKLGEEQIANSVGASSIKEAALKALREESGRQIIQLEGDLKRLSAQHEQTAEIASQAAEKEVSAIEGAGQRIAYTWETMNDQQRSFVEMTQSQFAAMKSEVQNAFQAIEQQSVVSVDQMISNLQTNIDAVDQWATNLETLADRGLNQGLIEQLRQAGPKAAAQTQALVEASDEQLQTLGIKWNEAGDEAKSGFLRGLNAAGVELPAEVQAMVTAIGDEFRSALAAAGFEVQGREIPQKIGDGIIAGAEGLAQSAAQLSGMVTGQFANLSAEGTVVGSNFGNSVASGVSASAITVVAQSALMGMQTVAQLATLGVQGATSGTAFGSGVAGGVTSTLGRTNSAAQGTKDGINKNVSSLPNDGRQAGQRFGSGMASGISGQQGAVSGASSGLRNSAMSQFAGNYNGGYNAGTSIGSGMSAGIYAMASSVASAAASIAANALAAAKSALAINSPSKKFRDIVGRAIPEGMASGIDKYSWYVDNSMTDLSKGAITSAKDLVSGFNLGLPKVAEIASGVNAMIGGHFSVGGFGGTTNSSSTVTNNYTLNANGQAHEDFFSPENMRRLLRELAYYVNQEEGRLA